MVKNILKKAFVFLVLSASFLTLNSKDTFVNVVSETTFKNGKKVF